MVDHALMAFVKRASGRVVFVVACLLYFGVGLVLPLSQEWSAAWLATANIVGTGLAALVSLGWLGLQLEAANRRRLVEWTSNLRLLTAEEFEWLVGELYRREGWKVRESGRQGGPDGNVDLDLTQPGRRVIVQCKRWFAWQVGVDEVRAFAGTLMREGLAGPDGVFVTLSGFTPQARAEAEAIGLALLDGRDLYARIERARRAEPCPDCRSPMVLAHSAHGWWLRCVESGCSGKRDLSRDPDRAVELLTLPPESA
jgi:restriction system protein